MAPVRRRRPAGTTEPLGLHFRFGDLIRAARIAHGFPNQTVAAERLEMGRFHLWELETGRIPPTDAERARLFRELPLPRALADFAGRLESPANGNVVARL